MLEKGVCGGSGGDGGVGGVCVRNDVIWSPQWKRGGGCGGRNGVAFGVS